MHCTVEKSRFIFPPVHPTHTIVTFCIPHILPSSHPSPFQPQPSYLSPRSLLACTSLNALLPAKNPTTATTPATGNTLNRFQRQ